MTRSSNRYTFIPITVKVDEKFAQANKNDEKILDIVVPYEGTRQLFDVKPSNYSWSTGHQQAAVVSDANFVLQYIAHDGAQVASRVEGDLKQILGNIASVNQDIARLNSSVFAAVQSVVTRRKQALDNRDQLAQNLGMPFKK